MCKVGDIIVIRNYKSQGNELLTYIQNLEYVEHVIDNLL